MAAAGLRHTAAVTEDGGVWAWGTGHEAQLGFGDREHRVVPRRVGGVEVFGSRGIAVAAGVSHTAAVMDDGGLWTWGDGASGQLGHGDEKPRETPSRVCIDIFGGVPVVMVACGFASTVSLTSDGEVWSWGYGGYGQLGHGDELKKLVPTRVRGLGRPIAMVAAGESHVAVVSATGQVYTWGNGGNGRLGHDDDDVKLFPAIIANEQFGGSKVVMTAAGGAHTVAVCANGALYSWGKASEGRLGQGKHIRDDQLLPARVLFPDSSASTSVVFAACGGKHTLAVCEDGGVWSWGRGGGGRLGHKDRNKRYSPSQLSCLSDVVWVAAGDAHSCAVKSDGSLWTWGQATMDLPACHTPRGLGHGDSDDDILLPTLLPFPTNVRKNGGNQRIPREHALAFAMCTHRRLSGGSGGGCVCEGIVEDLVKRIVEACGGVLLY